jgi:hypothetical protein
MGVSDSILFEGSGWLVVRIGETGRPTPWAVGTKWDFVDPRWAAARERVGGLEPIFVFQAPNGARYMQWCGQPFVYDKDHRRRGCELFADAAEPFLRFLKEFVESEELCGCCSLAFELLPHRLRTVDLCRRALIEDFDAGEHVPWENVSRAFMREAVRRDWMVLRYIPKDWLDKDVCTAAVLANPDALSAIPIELVDRKTLEELIKRRPTLLGHLAPGDRDCALIKLAEEACHGELPQFDDVFDDTAAWHWEKGEDL